MAYDEGLAQIFRDDFTEIETVIEKKMFGGLCFMNRGHMLCGVHFKNGEDGVMFRVGPDNYDAAMALEGIGELKFTGRPMKGLVEGLGEVLADDNVRSQVLAMALAFTNNLPPKKPKVKKPR
ncbi:MAG: hypothetical protein COA43_11795 [Robiginitomaculum sp.]|nr:MAG: hypothetical protein COA43_11795 [Robiginitomaculum sp.]